MKNIWRYKTPEGFDDLVMSGDGEALTGLWFAGSRDAVRRGEAVELRETPVFRETCRWLDEKVVTILSIWTNKLLQSQRKVVAKK